MLTAVRVLTAVVLALHAPAEAPIRERQQWVLDALNVEQAWQVTKGKGVTVAVIDSPVDKGVKELRDRVTVGPYMRSSAEGEEVAPAGTAPPWPG